MKTTSAAIKLLIFVVVTTLATGVLAVTIANTRFGDTRSYKAIFTDAAGLLNGDDVRVAGVRVGEVKKIKLYHGNQAEVTFTLAKQGPFSGGLPRSTLAQIRYRNLVGQRYLSLAQGPGTAGEVLPSGGVIPVTQTQPALDLTTLFNGFRPLFRVLEPADVNKLAFQIVQTLQGEGGTVNSLLFHVASLTNTIADRDKVIGQVIDNLNQVIGTIDERRVEVGQLISQLQAFVTGVAGDRKAIFDSLNSLNELTGATSDLLYEGRPSIKNDIAGLGKLANTLANNGKTLDTGLRRTPSRLNELARASSYGSWFNFYLCSFDARVVLPGGPAFQTPTVVNDNARCQ
ncbi:MAG TPA: MCE family protein [Streptosporangiaceae bacterium]|jgi:phospholipid/cholesterol/gamma-HCH transport system substrate-binding protein